jgi:hypothetical protein
MRRSFAKLSEGGLVGVPARAARELLRAHAENPHLGRACDVAEGFKYVQRWVRSNEGRGMFSSAKKGAESLMEMLELTRLPHSFLSEHVRESGLVSNKRLWQIHDECIKAAKEARPVNKSVYLHRVGKLSDHLEDGDAFKHIIEYRTGGTGAHARLAVVDQEQKKCCVHVFSLEEVKFLWKVGRKSRGPGEFMDLAGAVFDGRGHLWVSDEELKTIQTFDGQGNMMGCFGEKGFSAGEFSTPCEMALSAQGDVVVLDRLQNCVAVFAPDGKFLCTVPAAHDKHNIELYHPYRALPSADGNILVADYNCVRLFSSEGLFLKEVKPPELGSDEGWSPFFICTGPQGELVAVEDDDDGTICMRDADCGLLWSVEEPELVRVAIERDHKGRLFCRKAGGNDLQIWDVEFHDAS